MNTTDKDIQVLEEMRDEGVDLFDEAFPLSRRRQMADALSSILSDFRDMRELLEAAKKKPDAGGTDWVQYAKDYIEQHGSTSAEDVRALNEPYRQAILDAVNGGSNDE